MRLCLYDSRMIKGDDCRSKVLPLRVLLSQETDKLAHGSLAFQLRVIDPVYCQCVLMSLCCYESVWREGRTL